MSSCEKCSYYKGLDKSSCEFAIYVDIVDEAKSDMGLPCNDAEYQEYLSAKAQEGKDAAVELAS